ncbi:carboxymuconolactone decarboxylase family protein [Streptomyces sp. SCSIO 30461]|uniref:carboxymuconolactone decarboxylase family protein n=1 Tax=Streptomyces sp. SCSIO 30461 TaxID=3118085 RepID=UPI0030D328A8
MFTEHTLESAPQAARKALETVSANLGHLPEAVSAVARLAESPELLTGFLHVSGAFERGTLEPVAREVVIMTIAVRNDCHVCVVMHTGKLRALGADEHLTAALCEQRPLPDERLEGVRQFTLAVVAAGGAVSDDELRRFLTLGYTKRNALEVVLGIGAYTMSTYANRLTGAGLGD